MRDLLTRSLPDVVRERLDLTADEMVAVGLATRSAADVVEARARLVECRNNDDGTFGVVGYATTWETAYDVYGGAQFGGWSETIARGAADKSLRERDDVRFLVNHTGLTLARTKSGTMRLAADDLGLLVEVPSLDLRSPAVQELRCAIERGDIDEMSFAFTAVRQEWNGDYTERRITELRLFDVSAVTEPANPATIIGTRSATPADPPTEGMSLALAVAMADMLG